MKKYDALFIFPSALKEEALEAVLKDVDHEVSKLKGTVLDTLRLGARAFARTMKKTDAGYYVRKMLELDTQAVRPLQERFRLNENIFRVQITEAPKKKAEAPAAKKEGGSPDGQP